jgi:hypothetical protein
VEALPAVRRRWEGVQDPSRVSSYHWLHACGFSYPRTEKVFPSPRPAESAAFPEQVEQN